MKKDIKSEIKELLIEGEEQDLEREKEAGRMTTVDMVKTATELYFRLLEEKCPVKSRYYH